LGLRRHAQRLADVMRAWRAAALVCALAAACGGRSTLETGAYEGPAPSSNSSNSKPDRSNSGPGNSAASGSSYGGSNPGSSIGGSVSGGSNPGGPALGGADPGKPDPGKPDPGNPNPNPGVPTPDPGDPGTNPTPAVDVNCTSDHAKGGMACSVPCVTTCGFYDLGTRSCDCVNGVFVSCHCPRPSSYQGSTSAPECNTPDGRTHWIDNTACTNEWAECVGTDPVSGSNPRGCVCLTDPVNGKLEWTCGSTNQWFLHE
jgi:hypothetical protein